MLPPPPVATEHLSVRLAIKRALGLFLIFAATAPAWGAIAIDQVKSTDKSSSASSITSPSFSTTAANELLLVFVSTDAKSAGITITGVTGAGLTWALVRRTNAQLGTAEIWRAFASTTLTSVSVRANLSQSVPASITVVSFTGTDTSGTSGSGAIGATGSGNANPGAPTASLVTTRNGSWVFGVGNDWDKAISRTLGPNQTMVHQYLASVGDTYWVQRQNAPTPSSGTTVTINDTAPTTDRYNLSIVEVLPVLSNTTFTVTGTASPTSLVSGATVVLSQSGTTIATTTIGSNGSYTFSNIANGTYTVTPTQSGVNFSPTSQSVTVNGANATVPAFTATAQTWTVLGSITPATIAAGATVTLSQSGTTISTATVDSNGNYSFSNVVNGAYTVTPTQSGVIFSPTSQPVTVNNGNVTVPAFTATQVSDLTISKTHSGSFTQGRTGASYTITATNSGGAATSGTVTVTDTLPAGLTATAMSGTNWACTLSTLTCTRNDALAAGASYPAITLTVNVASNAPASVTNTATVSGGGETNTSNDTASDVTTVTTPPDLTVTKTHSGSFTQGQTGAIYTITVMNSGGAATSGTVTVTDTLPAGLTATALSGTNWACTLATLTCTRNDALAAGASYPAITLTVNVANNAAASVTNIATVSGGGETNTSNDTANDVTTITGAGALIHVGGASDHPTVTNGVMTFNYTPVGPDHAVVALVGCRQSGVTSISLTAPGWTLTPISGLVGPSSYFDYIGTFGAITPNASPVTFTATWTPNSINCNQDTTIMVDEFAGNDLTGGTTTFDAHNESLDNGVIGICTGAPVTPANNNDAIWYGCYDNVTGVSGGYTKGQDDTTGDWTEYKILSGGLGVAQNAGFVTNPSFFSFGLGGVSIKPAGSASGIALVQKNVNGNEGTITSISANFLSNNTAGNFLIVTGTAARPAGTLSISDTLGNTYTPAMGPVTDTNQNVTAYIWYVPSCKGGANTVTLTPATAAALEIHISEWTGLATTSPVDQTASATGTGTAVSSGAATTTVNGELIFGYTFLYNTATAGAGFTPLSLVNGDLDEYQVQNTAGSIAATFTQTSGTWFALMATFKPAGSGSGTTYSISGAVSPAAAGYNLALSGTATANTTTNSSGSYSFNGLGNGSYTVTPSEAGFSFTPASQNVSVSGNSVPGINFTAQSTSTTSALAIDVNVSKDNGTAANSITSPAFSTTATNELLLALVATDSLSSNMTVTGVTGAGLTWSLVRRTNAQGGTSEIWRAFAASALSNVSVTASLSQSVLSSMTVLSFSGVDPTGPIGATGSGSAASGAPTASLTTTRNNSWVVGVGNDYTNAIARTVPSNQTLIHQDLSSTGDTYWMQRQNAPTPTSGTVVTINDTAPTGDQYNLAIVEVLPAQTALYSISGNISPTTGGAGAAVALSGTVSETVMSDGSGNYSFTSLPSGSYTITPSLSGYVYTPTSQSVTVGTSSVTGVNFTAAPVPILAVDKTGLAFTGNQGGSNPAPQVVNVTNAGNGTLSFVAGTDSAWLTVSPTSGTAPQQLQMSVNISGSVIGTYTGHVTVTSSGSQGSPATINVTLIVGIATDWLMVDHDPSRGGYAVDETTLSNSNVANLALNWTAIMDGSVTTQPLYVHNYVISGLTKDVVIVGTAGNSLYALDASNGTVIWKRNFGAPTPNNWAIPDGFGIEAPPVIDRVAGRVYTVSTDGNFHTLSLADGSDVYPALALIANSDTNKVWGGLNKVGNSIYIASASNGGDVSPWRGQIYQVDVSATPTLVSDFVVVPEIAAPNGGGGIWGYGGVSADLALGNIYAASAYDSNQGTLPYADRVLALDSHLNLLGSYLPAEPSPINCSAAPCDLDFGATPVFFQPPGCSTLVAVGNKNGNLYLFKTSDLAANGQPLQILTLNVQNDSLGSGGVGGNPAYSPPDNMLFVSDAGPGVTGISAGIVALQVTNSCTLQVAWSHPLSGNDTPNSTPTVTNGVVYIGEGNTGIIHAYNTQTGAQLWHSGSNYGAAATFAAPTIAGGKLFTGSWTSFNGGGIVGSFSLP